MSTPTFVFWLSSYEDRRRVETDLLKVRIPEGQNYIVVASLVEMTEVISPDKPQLLVVGDVEGDGNIVSMMKKKNARLKAARLGLARLSKPPAPPFDMLVTKAHPDHSYVESLTLMMSEFNARQRKRGS